MSSTATNFLNSKRRRIYQGASGAFFAQAANGSSKVYNPKAMYRKVGGGSTRRVAEHNTVPNKIRSKKYKLSTLAKRSASPYRVSASPMMLARKVRRNKGAKRGPRSSPIYNLAHAVFRTRKVRKNKGAKRGPRARPVGGVKPMGTHIRFM